MVVVSSVRLQGVCKMYFKLIETSKKLSSVSVFHFGRKRCQLLVAGRLERTNLLSSPKIDGVNEQQGRIQTVDREIKALPFI